MKHRIISATAGLLAVSAAAHAQGWSGYLDEGGPPHPVTCAAGHGGLEPYVPDAATAKAIFLAVETARAPNANRSHFPMIDVFDKGDRWVVFRHNATDIGGGQLELEIGKCTGRIYRAAFGR